MASAHKNRSPDPAATTGSPEPPVRPGRRRSSASLWPREHGAYAQCALPTITTLALALPSLGALGFALSTVSGFLAHEPLLVVMGRRGHRRQRELGNAARTRLLVLSALGAVGAFVGLLYADRRTLIAFGVVVGLVALAGVLIWYKREKTIPGELLVATVFSVAAVPVALSSGVGWPIPFVVVTVWMSTFTLGTLTVHAVLRRAKLGSMKLAWVNTILGLAAIGGATVGGTRGSWWALALVPPAVAALAVVALGWNPKHLRRIGWSLMAAQVVVLVTLVSTLQVAAYLAV